MLRPLSVNEIQQACNELGLSISTDLVERIERVFNATVQTFEEPSDGTRTPENSHDALDAAIQEFIGCPRGSRNLERREVLRPAEVRRALDSLHRAKVAMTDVGFKKATLDLLFDYLVDELVPLSQGRPSIKGDAKKRALFDVLADLYVTEIQNGAKLTETSTGMKFIRALLSRAGVYVEPRTLRSWEEKRPKKNVP